MTTFQDFSPTFQGPNDSFSAGSMELSFGPWNVRVHWSPLYGEKSCNVFIKNLNFFLTEERKKDMDILDDMGVSKLSAKVYLLLLFFLKWTNPLKCSYF